MYEQSLYKILEDAIPENVIKSNNKKRLWQYGYNKEYDVVVISKSGMIGEVYEIQNLKIALPKEEDVYHFENNYWSDIEYPRELSKIKSVFDWDKYSDNF